MFDHLIGWNHQTGRGTGHIYLTFNYYVFACAGDHETQGRRFSTCTGEQFGHGKIIRELGTILMSRSEGNAKVVNFKTSFRHDSNIIKGEPKNLPW